MSCAHVPSFVTYSYRVVVMFVMLADRYLSPSLVMGRLSRFSGPTM